MKTIRSTNSLQMAGGRSQTETKSTQRVMFQELKVSYNSLFLLYKSIEYILMIYIISLHYHYNYL